MSDDARRIAELEEQLRQARAEAERYKRFAYLFSQGDGGHPQDDRPLTREEVQRMLTDTDGTPILEIVAEVERTQP